MKLLGWRLTSPTSSTFPKRFCIFSQSTLNCISARRLPIQRWTPKPKETCCRAFSLSMINRSSSGKTLSSRFPDRNHMIILSPFVMGVWYVICVSQFGFGPDFKILGIGYSDLDLPLPKNYPRRLLLAKSSNQDAFAIKGKCDLNLLSSEMAQTFTADPRRLPLLQPMERLFWWTLGSCITVVSTKLTIIAEPSKWSTRLPVSQ